MGSNGGPRLLKLKRIHYDLAPKVRPEHLTFGVTLLATLGWLFLFSYQGELFFQDFIRRKIILLK